MSSLKQSLGSSNVQRQSRLPVRQSNASRVRRSSSLQSSNVNTNLLTAYSSGRSNSCTNLVTPLRRIECSTPSSSVSSISIVHDKDWQKNQLQKVRMFFRGSNPEIILKPLSIRTYVSTMDILFKQLDSRISITLSNYKDSVPDYLKSFKYPYNLKPSVVKTPAVPSSLQFILQIWTWLIDTIDILQNPEVALLQVMDEGALKSTYSANHYMAERFVAFNKEGEAEDDVDKRFLMNLAHEKDINIDNIKQLDEEDAYLDKQLESLREAYNSSELAIKDISHKNSNLRDENATKIQKNYEHRNELIDRMRILSIRSKNLDENVAANEEEVKTLTKFVSQQPHTKEDLVQIKRKIEESSTSEKYKKESCEELAHLIEEYDSKLTYPKHMLTSTVYKINNKIASLICKAPELKDLQIPETSLSEPNFDCYIKNFNEKMKNLNINTNMELKQLETTCKTFEEDNKKGTRKLENLEIEEKKILETQKESECTFNKKREDIQKKIYKKRTSEMVYKIKNLVSGRPNIDLLEKKLEAAVKKEADLDSLSDEMVSKGKDLILTCHNNIRSIMDTEKTIMCSVQKTIDESLNVDLSSLADIINALKEKEKE